MGDLSRKPFRPATTRKPKSSDKRKGDVVYAGTVEPKRSALLKMRATCPARVFLLQEAAGIDNDELAPLLGNRDRAWRWATSCCKTLAGGARETANLRMRFMCDPTDCRV